jgi:nitrogen regulatory protein P-II 1
MKKIEAMIRSERLEAGKSGLEKIGINAMTITDVLGRGEQKGLWFIHRAGKYRGEFRPKVKVELVVTDDNARKAIDAIVECARTGEIGNG